MAHGIPRERSSFKCADCDKCFSRLSRLSDHRASHQSEKPHQCPYCEASYPYQTNLRRHIRLKHEDLNDRNKQTNKTPSKPTTNEKSTEKKFICELCGKVMKSRYALSCHKQRHTGKRPFQVEFHRLAMQKK